LYFLRRNILANVLHAFRQGGTPDWSAIVPREVSPDSPGVAGVPPRFTHVACGTSHTGALPETRRALIMTSRMMEALANGACLLF
jgi:hypothetical protein